MWKIRASRRFLTKFLFISAILFNVQLINTEIINPNNSLETYLPDLIPNEDAIINSNQTSVIASVSSSSTIEEDQIQSTSVNKLKSTTQIQEDQTYITNNQVDTTEETSSTIEFNIKHETSNPSFISAIESRIIATTEESSSPQLFSIANTRFEPLDMNELPIKVQKCCPSGQIMVLGKPGERSICQVSNEDFDVPVFHSNSTHYWNYTSTASSDVEIVARDPCKQSKFFMDPNDDSDIFRILSNSSLYIPFNMDMLNIDQYCVDTIQSDTIFTTAVICTSPPKINIFHFLYIAGLIVSVVSLILLATYSMRRKDIKDDHKKCLAFFAGTMAIAYIFVTIQTTYHNYFNYNINLTIAYLIHYLNLNYYLWLNMLLFDTCRCVRGSDTNTISYMKWYTIATYLIPLLFVLFSFIDGFNPAVPSVYLDHNFSSSIASVIVLYILPVSASIIGNFGLICCLSLPKERYNNVKDFIATFQSKDWKAPPRNIKEIKKMYRRIMTLLVLIIGSFILDMVICFLPSTGTQQVHFVIRDTIYCLLGLFISLTFFRKHWFCSRCCKRNTNIINEAELMPMTNGTV